MHSCELTFKTIGLDDNTLAIIKNIQPLPRFSHKFETFNNFSDLKNIKNYNDNNDENENNKNFVFIFDSSTIRAESNFKIILKELKDNAAFKISKIIFCTEKIEKIYNYIDEIWIKPFTPELIKFYFLKLQERLKLEKDLLSYEQNYEIQHSRRLMEMARQDYLTGLATRWYFQDYVNKNKDEKHLTFIYFDLDHFKAVNDTYGHQAGDRALAATAEMMQREFADGFIARFGGDEFVTILSGYRQINDVERQVKNFMDKLLEYYHEIPAMRNLSISAGIAQTNPDELKSIDQLIHESDRALYCAKNCGRACCCIYNPAMENAENNLAPEIYMKDGGGI